MIFDEFFSDGKQGKFENVLLLIENLIVSGLNNFNREFIFFYALLYFWPVIALTTFYAFFRKPKGSQVLRINYVYTSRPIILLKNWIYRKDCLNLSILG